jgi:hypothetical protein
VLGGHGDPPLPNANIGTFLGLEPV